MEFIRVEVREITSRDLPPVILPKVSGHRRVYVQAEGGKRYMLNIMCIGDIVDGVTYGAVDFAMSNTGGPEKYFESLTPEFMRIARERGLDQEPVAFIAIIDPVGPKLVKVLDRQNEQLKTFSF